MDVRTCTQVAGSQMYTLTGMPADPMAQYTSRMNSRTRPTLTLLSMSNSLVKAGFWVESDI